MKLVVHLRNMWEFAVCQFQGINHTARISVPNRRLAVRWFDLPWTFLLLNMLMWNPVHFHSVDHALHEELNWVHFDGATWGVFVSESQNMVVPTFQDNGVYGFEVQVRNPVPGLRVSKGWKRRIGSFFGRLFGQVFWRGGWLGMIRTPKLLEPGVFVSYIGNDLADLDPFREGDSQAFVNTAAIGHNQPWKMVDRISFLKASKNSCNSPPCSIGNLNEKWD